MLLLDLTKFIVLYACEIGGAAMLPTSAVVVEL
jgi:hypothetical protein